MRCWIVLLTTQILLIVSTYLFFYAILKIILLIIPTFHFQKSHRFSFEVVVNIYLNLSKIFHLIMFRLPCLLQEVLHVPQRSRPNSGGFFPHIGTTHFLLVLSLGTFYFHYFKHNYFSNIHSTDD